MIYQDIVNILRATSTALDPAVSFFHGNRKAMALEFAKPFPQTHLYPIRTEEDEDGNCTHSISIIFWEQDSLKNSKLDTEAIMQASQTRLRAYVAYLRANYPTISVGRVFMTNEEKTITATASGYGAQFTIISKMPCP